MFATLAVISYAAPLATYNAIMVKCGERRIVRPLAFLDRKTAPVAV